MDNKEFKNKNILITGGSKGIGYGLVESFLKRGGNVYTFSRKKNGALNELQETYSENLYLHLIDATSSSYTTTLLEWLKDLKSVDILINNVGDALQRSSFENSSLELWRNSFEVNFFSTLGTIKALLPKLKNSQNSKIINISSIAGRSSGAGDSMHYGVSKAALDSLTKGLATELGSYNIRCLSIAPSAIDTDFQKRLSSKERVQQIVDGTPLGRIGCVDDIVEPVLFFCSDKASYISGNVIYITGGR